jgi:3-hydroxyacyl-[acyl-carrier-protein] dehydratase
MERIWDIHKIRQILPHAYPFLFVDRVVAIEEEKGMVVCLKNVTATDYFFQGHFPDNPVMPGVIIIEALAQASIILFAVLKPLIAEKHPDYYFGKVEARFYKPVSVGDELVLEARKEKLLSTGGIVSTRALVDEKVVTQATIMFSVKPKK